MLEVAILNVRPGQSAAFEAAFREARQYIAATPGFISLEPRRCVENPDQYLLLVHWRALQDHTIGFRQSPQYQDWKRLLHHFYDPFPTVEHYESNLAVVALERSIRSDKSRGCTLADVCGQER